jgi:D-alanine-D-alanine ligase
MNSPASCVLVLHEKVGPNARPDELDTLHQAEQVCAALNRLGWRAERLATDLDLEATLASIQSHHPVCVFNLVESLGGHGELIHLIPALLGAAGIAFTGAGAEAIYNTSNKLAAKKLMALTDIPTAQLLGDDLGLDGGGHAYIVKSVWEHASFGMDDGCVVDGASAARARIESCRARLGGDWFAERFVAGREFNIAMLGNGGHAQILAMAEMSFAGYPVGKPKIVGYAAKWDEAAPEYSATQRIFPTLPDQLAERLRQIALRCWTEFGLRGYARVDIRLDANERPFVLEINANPCLAREAGFAAAAAQTGMQYEQLIARIVSAALPIRADLLHRAG